MAAEGIIKVNPDILNSTASEFGGQATSLQNLTGQMMNLVTGLSSAWQGEASTAYIGKFQGLQDDMDKMFKMIQEHSTDLQEMAAAYISAEQANAEVAQSLYEDGFRIFATGKTWRTINDAGIPCVKVKKLYEGRPNILDFITNGDIQLIVNSPSGKESIHDDSYLRKAAIKNKIPYITTMAAAKAAAEGIAQVYRRGAGQVRSPQEWHSLIKA